jgi:HEAT repeat protein
MFSRLYVVKDRGVQESLRGFLAPDTPEAVLAGALAVLHSHQDLGAFPACRSLVEKDERSGVRALAAAYLYRFGEEDRAADLAREIAGGDVGSTAFFRIESFLTSAGSVADEILDAFTELLSASNDSSVLSRTARLLGRYRYGKARKRLRELLDHDDRNVAKEALEALASIPGGLEPAALRKLLDAEDPDRRLRAAHALRRMDDLSGFSRVVEVLESGTDAQRTEAARILGGFRIEAAVAPLLDALLDPYPSVRSYAASGLRSVLSSLFPYRRFDLASAGYGYRAPEAERRLAVERIRKWWVEHRSGDW